MSDLMFQDWERTQAEIESGRAQRPHWILRVVVGMAAAAVTVWLEVKRERRWKRTVH